MNSKLSLICVYNNPDMYHNLMLRSLNTQNFKDIEIIGVNSVEGGFSSASSALNYGAKQAHGEILLFIHQDVEFLNDNCLNDLIEAMHSTETGDIVGAAGATLIDGKYELCSSMLWGALYKTYNAVWVKKGELRSVDSLDECFFCMNRETWEKHPFDEDICNDWHFYAVEMCMYAKSQSHNVYVANIPICHKSRTGTKTKGYFSTLIKLGEKYQQDLEYVISTTTFTKCKDVRKRAYKGYIKLLLGMKT